MSEDGFSMKSLLGPNGGPASDCRNDCRRFSLSHPMGEGRGALPLKLIDIHSEHDFFNTSLKVIRTVKRRFATPGHFSIRTHCHRTTLKKFHQLGNYLGGWFVAVEQVQHLILQRMIGIGAVDLPEL